jgi:hypothetical protein
MIKLDVVLKLKSVLTLHEILLAGQRSDCTHYVLVVELLSRREQSLFPWITHHTTPQTFHEPLRSGISSNSNLRIRTTIHLKRSIIFSLDLLLLDNLLLNR